MMVRSVMIFCRVVSVENDSSGRCLFCHCAKARMATKIKGKKRLLMQVRSWNLSQ